MKFLLKKKFTFLLLIILVLSIFGIPMRPVFATAESDACKIAKSLTTKLVGNGTSGSGGTLSPDEEEELSKANIECYSSYGLDNPLKTGSIATVISRVIQFLLALSGSVALLMFVWGGFQYLWSAGDENKVKSGKNTLKNALFGLVIIVMAYILVTSLVALLTNTDVASALKSP